MILTPETKTEIAAVFGGLLFGIAMQRGRVHEISLIIGQMTFTHFVMLKMFLSALGTSMLVASQYFKTADAEALEKSWDKSRTPYEIIIGAAILGIGMTVSGSCPGSVYPQLGALSFTALFVLLGGIIGNCVFSKYQETVPARIGQQLHHSQNALHKIINSTLQTNLTPSYVAFVGGSALLGAVFLLELLVPWKSDIAHLYGGSTEAISLWRAQPPMVSGIMIGLAQYLVTSNNERLGCTMSYQSHVSQVYSVLSPCHDPISTKLKSFMTTNIASCDLNRTNHFQWVLTLSMVVGSFISSLFTWSWYVGNNAQDFVGISPLRSLLGGFLIVFGSRFAQGCTSGHGLSGAGFLSTASLLAVASMFGAAIATGVFFKVFGI